MAPSRRRKASTPPTSAPQPSPPMGLGAKIMSLFREKPLETLGLLAVLGPLLGGAVISGVAGLGFVTLQAREALLDSPGLSYPKQEWLATGFGALGALLRRGLSVLASDHSVLQGSAWTLLLLLVGVVLATRSTRRPALLLGALALATLLLSVGTGFYRIALAATSPPYVGSSGGFHCGERLSANLEDQAAFETCSWLVNDTPRNDQRRSDLAGLLGWLLAVCLAAVVAGACASVASRRLSRVRWVLVGTHALLGLLLLYDLPRAHAFATWGLRYPLVQILEACDQTRDHTLAPSTADGSCWAFDVSAGAEKKVVLLQGPGCPDHSSGTFFYPGHAAGGGECVSSSSKWRVITDGPNP